MSRHFTWHGHIGRKLMGFGSLLVVGTFLVLIGRMSGEEFAALMGPAYAVLAAAVAYEKGKANNG